MIQSSIKIGGRTYTAEGETIVEVIGNLPVGNAKGRGILILQKGDARKERILTLQRVIQLFGKGSPNVKAVILKQTALLFDKTLFEE